MGGFFNMDGDFVKTMSKLYDIVFLSILWVVFSLPIVTIGASTTALYYTAVKVIRHDRSYIWHSFWKSFKDNFVDATIFWLLLLVLYVILGINIFLSESVFGKTLGAALKGIYILIFILESFSGIYIFPLQSRFRMKRLQLLKLSVFMGIRHLFYSLCMGMLGALAVISVYLITPFILVMPAAATLFISFFMERILKIYMPEENDENLDRWYLE